MTILEGYHNGVSTRLILAALTIGLFSKSADAQLSQQILDAWAQASCLKIGISKAICDDNIFNGNGSLAWRYNIIETAELQDWVKKNPAATYPDMAERQLEKLVLTIEGREVHCPCHTDALTGLTITGAQ